MFPSLLLLLRPLSLVFASLFPLQSLLFPVILALALIDCHAELVVFASASGVKQDIPRGVHGCRDSRKLGVVFFGTPSVSIRVQFLDLLVMRGSDVLVGRVPVDSQQLVEVEFSPESILVCHSVYSS